MSFAVAMALTHLASMNDFRCDEKFRMKILLTGGSGMVGRNLLAHPALAAFELVILPSNNGHRTKRLVLPQTLPG